MDLPHLSNPLHMKEITQMWTQERIIGYEKRLGTEKIGYENVWVRKRQGTETTGYENDWGTEM